jgi:hypothetical protein
VPAVLKSAEYLLDLSGDSPVMTADFEARIFTEDWHSLPLFGGSARLKSSDDSASVVWRDKVYALLTNKVGDIAAHLDLTMPAVTEWNDKEGFQFYPSPANRTVFTITGIPPGRQIRLGELNPSTRKKGKEIYHLSGDEGTFRIYLEEAAVEEPILPSVWTLHSQIMIRYSEGRLTHSARIQAQADSGSGMSMELELPPNVSRVTLEGEDIGDWKLGPRTKDSRSLKVSWETPNALDRSLLLKWELPQSALSDQWALTPPRADNEGGGSKTLIAMAPVDGLELTHPEVQASGESRRLPEWLRNEVGTEDCLITELTGGESISLAATWLPRLKTAQATVSLAKFSTRLVSDGSMLVKADYTVQHGSPLNWVLELPSADQILTCEINQKGASPIQREENKIEFRLPPATSDSGTRIHLCYALKADALDPVSGRVTLELPRTDLFIHRLDWALVIPGQYEPTAVQGNVQLGSNKDNSDEVESGNLIRLEKELCRGERPAVEIFYQRKDLANGS